MTKVLLMAKKSKGKPFVRFPSRSFSSKPLRNGASGAIVATATAFLGLLAVVTADVLLGTRFGVLLFYLVPIAWAAWLGGQNPALVVTVFCAFARFGVEIVEEHNVGVSRPELIWSIGSELTFFLLFVGLLLKIHVQLDTERDLARTDGLTHLLNARAFEEALKGEHERLRRYGRTLSLVYFDLDNFKAVNDKLGHATGDELLRAVARVMASNIRHVDAAARLGGDEFALLLPETDQNGARIVLERLNAKLGSAMEQKKWPVSASWGCVTFEKAPRSWQDLVKAADSTMYFAKNGGKNRMELRIWQGDIEQESAEVAKT